MNPLDHIRQVKRSTALFARHALALLITVAASCIAWTVMYAMLFLWAVLTGGGLGGPLAYPFGLLVVAVATAGVCFLLFLPACAAAEWIARRHGLPVLAQIPLSVGALFVLCAVSAFAAWVGGLLPTLSNALLALAVALLVQLVPLGLYWWVAKGGPVLLSILRSALTRTRAILSALSDRPEPAGASAATRR